jgi:hypothetical protein
MSELFIFLVIGLGFLILLLVWVLQGVGSPVSGTRLSEAEAVLTAVQMELPPRALGERIFSPEDWDFITAHTTPGIQRLFLRERKILAYSWLRQTRRNIGRLMDFHRKAVRRNIRLDPSLEFRLALDYALFLLMYEILLGLIWLRGPFCARRIVGYAASMADQLAYLSGHILVHLDPARLNRIKNGWSV